jgi:hypothetical protein
MPYHDIREQNHRKNRKPWKYALALYSISTQSDQMALGDKKYAQAHFSAKPNLAKLSNRLASRSAGLGLGATLKSKPKPEKARLRGCKPVFQAENLTLNTATMHQTHGSTGSTSAPIRGKLPRPHKLLSSLRLQLIKSGVSSALSPSNSIQSKESAGPFVYH